MLHAVRRGRDNLVPFRQHPEPPHAVSFESMQPGQSRDPVSVAHDPRREQSVPHLDGPIARLGLLMELLHLLEQACIRSGPRRGWPASPRIVAAPTHAQRLAQLSEPVLRVMRRNKLIRHGDPLVKYMAVGSGDQCNTIWGKVELEGDRDGTYGASGLSAAQKADLWQRWKQGQSLSEIGRALGKHAGSIHGVVSSNGGFIPAGRRRSRWALTLAEREEISHGLAAARSIRQIAATLGRAPSTVSREITRGVGPTPIAPHCDLSADRTVLVAGGVTASKVRTVYSGIDLSDRQLTHDDQAISQMIGLPNGAVLIRYLANLFPRKRYVAMFQALLAIEHVVSTEYMKQVYAEVLATQNGRG